MNQLTLMIRPRDPILVRDGRPFGADPGAAAFSLPFPLPSTVAGAVRSCIGNANGFDWQSDGPAKALKIEVHGPLLAVAENDSWVPYFHAPADAVCYKSVGQTKEIQVMRLCPWCKMPEGAGCDLPDGLLPVKVTAEEKPELDYEFWSFGDLIDWLTGNTKVPEHHLPALPTETRTHVKIGPDAVAEPGMLFSTRSLCFKDVPVRVRSAAHSWPQIALLCKVSGSDQFNPAVSFIPFGGERRVAAVEKMAGPGNLWPSLPGHLRDTLVGKKQLKLQLVTPAIFAQGWKPGWIGDALTGSPPGCKLRLKLVSAAVKRKEPVSGWSYAPLPGTGKPGPKKARFMAPAGSVYFFEVVEGDIDDEAVNQLWLTSVSDEEQDRRDGFGLVVPGVWDHADNCTEGRDGS